MTRGSEPKSGAWGGGPCAECGGNGAGTKIAAAVRAAAALVPVGRGAPKKGGRDEADLVAVGSIAAPQVTEEKEETKEVVETKEENGKEKETKKEDEKETKMVSNETAETDVPSASAAGHGVRADTGSASEDLGRTVALSSLSAASPSSPEFLRCPCCATHNLAAAVFCDRCSSPLDEGAALDRVVQLAAAYDIKVNALDNVTALTDDGYLVGPDGASLLGAGASGGGMSDRELQLAKGASLRAPLVPFFAATGGASGGTALAADRGVSVRAKVGPSSGGAHGTPKPQRGPSALEVRLGYQAAEAQHIADVREDKARRAAGQALATAEAAREAASRARGVVAAAACMAAWDARKTHTECKAAAALRKRKSKADRKDAASAAVAVHAADVAAARVARKVAAKAAKRERRKDRADVTALAARLWAAPGPMHLKVSEPVHLEVVVLVDSGAGATFVDNSTYMMLGSPPYQDEITVSDVSNTVTTAYGIGPLYGDVLNASGAWVSVKLATHAYTSEAFGVNLFSVGAGLKAGWNASFSENLLTNGHVEVPLEEAANTWTFRLRVAPPPADTDGATAAFGMASDAAPAATTLVYANTARLNPFGRAGRQAAVHWTSRGQPLAFADTGDGDGGGTTGDGAEGEGTTESQGGGGVTGDGDGGGVTGDGAEGEGTTESQGGGCVTTDSLAASVVRREQLQRERHAAYVYYHNAFNHQNCAVDELIRLKLIDAEQPSGFSCPACARAKAQQLVQLERARGRQPPLEAVFDRRVRHLWSHRRGRPERFSVSHRVH